MELGGNHGSVGVARPYQCPMEWSGRLTDLKGRISWPFEEKANSSSKKEVFEFVLLVYRNILFNISTISEMTILYNRGLAG